MSQIPTSDLIKQLYCYVLDDNQQSVAAERIYQELKTRLGL